MKFYDRRKTSELLEDFKETSKANILNAKRKRIVSAEIYSTLQEPHPVAFCFIQFISLFRLCSTNA